MRTANTPSIPVIINTSSGTRQTEQILDDFTTAIRSGGLEPSVNLAGSGVAIFEHALRSVAERPEIVVAGGGDGTINAVASALAGTDIALGVLPLGTLNHFAKDLQIPLQIENAARNILEGHIVKVDVGEVNNRVFINNSSMGLYPSIVRHRQQQQERLGRGKWPAFAWAAITLLRRCPFLDIRLSVEDRELTLRTPFIFVGNNEYQMEGFNIGVRRCLDAGHLSLYVPNRAGRLGLVRLGLSALFGRLRKAKDFDALRARDIRIETKGKHATIALDGEITVLSTPLHYRIRPAALSVIVPRGKSSLNQE